MFIYFVVRLFVVSEFCLFVAELCLFVVKLFV